MGCRTTLFIIRMRAVALPFVIADEINACPYRSAIRTKRPRDNDVTLNLLVLIMGCSG